MSYQNTKDVLSVDYPYDASASEKFTEKVVLEIKNLSVSFDGFKAVDNLSINIQKNELRVIIGPNGAGKTTLLDMICGKTRPTSGEIWFERQEVSKFSEHKIVQVGIGRKFQNPSVYEDLTVLENFEISIPYGQTAIGSLSFRRDSKVLDTIDAIAHEVYLSDYLNHKAGILSHGQKQWLEIGMLLIQEPRLLMLDEPVAGMSPKEREQTAELLKKISKGKSILVIEHDMDFVKSIANKITVLHQGKLLSEGTADDIQNDKRVIEVYLGH